MCPSIINVTHMNDLSEINWKFSIPPSIMLQLEQRTVQYDLFRCFSFACVASRKTKRKFA